MDIQTYRHHAKHIEMIIKLTHYCTFLFSNCSPPRIWDSSVFTFIFTSTLSQQLLEVGFHSDFQLELSEVLDLCEYIIARLTKSKNDFRDCIIVAYYDFIIKCAVHFSPQIPCWSKLSYRLVISYSQLA